MCLKASDGHELEAYVAETSAPARAGVVIIQEVFGVNDHIRSVADDYAEQGCWAIAPALFDRVERCVELGYSPDESKRGMQMASRIGMDTALKDVEAAMNSAAKMLGEKKIGVIGYCWGGSLAWLAATRLSPAAAVAYYGGQIARYAGETPRCPVMLHFGEKDAHIPRSDIDAIKHTHPEVPVFLYDAGHGFNCDRRASYEPRSAALARQRTLDFLREHL